jgi:hypothetical protein
MTRTLKGLTALLALGLFMSMSVAAAQATPTFTAGKYPATVTGFSEIVIGTGASSVTCPVEFDGTLSAASSTLELGTFFQFFNCKAWGFVNMTINNQCKQVFHATEKQSADQYKAHYQLKCPTSTGTVLTAGTCAIEITPQEGRTSVDIDTDTGSPNRVTLDYEVTGLAYTVTKDGFLCPLEGLGAKTNGTITGETMVLRAFNASKTTEEVGLAVSGE